MPNRKLSPLMVHVLAQCQAAEPETRIPVSVLVKAQTSRGVSASVAKAVISRTLRRLWARGLVELYAWPGRHTATAIRAGELARLRECEADPSAYVAGLARFTKRPLPPPDELMARLRKQAERPFPSHFRVIAVSGTVVQRVSD